MSIDLSGLNLAFQAGVYAFLNPCGFALLPSYISYYLSNQVHAAETPHFWEPGLRGLKLGAMVSAGFFTIFILVGLVLALISHTIGTYFPWIAALLGGLLVILGFANLVGKGNYLFSTANWAARAFSQSTDKTSFIFYYFYGVGYAIASCGCVLPIFMVWVVLPSLGAGILISIINFSGYALGMSLMMLLLSVAISYSKRALDRTLPLRWAIVGLTVSIMIFLSILWKLNWGSPEFYETNQFLLFSLSPLLLLMLIFQLRRWNLATRLMNALILILAGSFMVYYQLCYSGILSICYKQN